MGYLKNNRASFVNNVHQGQIKITSSVSLNELDLECQDTGTNYMMKLPKLDSPILNRSSENFDIKTLIKWSVEIADGMEYLASKKVKSFVKVR
ncbi:unnamed protein product [Orchesella dallaii]|uniref:Uncharacterized protein n=1 Tax=Orchesella dallaii TaxID=48710 RepID=A0ABP1QV68_9HEXA